MKIRNYMFVLASTILMGTTVKGIEAVNLSQLTREEAATAVVNMLGYQGVSRKYDAQKSSFLDVTSNKGSIELVSQWGFMNGVGNNLFAPQGSISQEQNNVINQRIQQTLAEDIEWKHGFYAIASSEQMNFIPYLDAVSFGWAQVKYDVNKGFWINTGATNDNDFRIPTGFNKPIDLAKANGVETYMMVYFEDSNGLASKLLNDPMAVDKLINDLVKMCDGITKDGMTRGFDGLTIDFENFISEDLQQPFNTFLKKLEQKLEAKGKKLNVAVQPATYFKGYDYQEIGVYADKVILMAHDYAAKKMSRFEKEIGQVYTPVTPIDQVYKDVMTVINEETGIQDQEKVVLQVSFGSVQWQTKDGQVIHDYAYTPSYDKIHARLQIPGTTVVFDENVGNPYARYTVDGVTNTIWYENAQSVELKENLIKLLDLGGVSYWRLGTIPSDVSIK